MWFCEIAINFFREGGLQGITFNKNKLSEMVTKKLNNTKNNLQLFKY